MNQQIVDIASYKDVIFYAYKHQLWEYRLTTNFHSIVADLTNHDQLYTAPIRKLAVDWENKRIYVLTELMVTLVDFFGEGLHIIHHQNTIGDIAVDPVERYLFYAETGVVKRTHLDGVSNSYTIFRALRNVFDKNVQGGEALALDPNTRTIYYIYRRVLYSFGYKGDQSVIMDTRAPYAKLEPFEDRLYANYRADAGGLVSLHRSGYTFTEQSIDEWVKPPNEVVFHRTRPRTMSILHITKFPESHKTSKPCFSSEVCRSGWCFPLPDSNATGHRCVCSVTDRDSSCIQSPLTNYKPQSAIGPEEYNAASSVFFSAFTYTAAASSVLGIVTAKFLLVN